ncbi:toprim domain-containing protein [Bacteroides cellulosilyticus]|uniref:toprim domain-containing protein n=1 Tax=Bacteroides cellulosilyticus TaxID=246787 RepID=UPI0032F05C53
MTIQEAKQIRIADYLQSLGYTPVKRQGNSLWYKSPLREETEASFKVNTELNQWYDFGIGKGGNIIALASELYRSDNVPYLLERIAKQTPHLHTANHTPSSFGRQSVSEPMFRHLQVVDLSSLALLSYLQERGINAELAKKECRELHYIYEGKPYFAIGFPNMAEGYEVRNRYFKGCVAPKDITHIRQSGEPRSMCYLFEGFMDYLSFLTIRVRNNPQCPRLTTQDYVILNSVSNLAKAEGILATYSRIGSFLDNDTAGRTACEHLQAKFGERLSDKSIYYRGYKDLNDYLCSKSLPQSAEPMKQKQQVQSVKRMVQPPKKRGLKM